MMQFCRLITQIFLIYIQRRQVCSLPTKADVIAHVLAGSNITDRGTALMIGDRKYDILGAKTVGIDSAGVLYGYGDRAELEAAGADYILPAIPDLEELLLE